MSRAKPITVIGCSVRYGEEHTMVGGMIVTCLRCRGIGFFDITGTYVRDSYWINAKNARTTHENNPRAIRDSFFHHWCARDTKHPINKLVNQKRR